MANQVQRFLRTEELYKEIIGLIPEAVIRAVGGETVVRGKLDAILSQGKIEGRLSGLVHDPAVSWPDNDRLIEDWQRIVDSVTTGDSSIVAYTVGSLWLCCGCGSQAPTAEPVARYHLLRGQSYLCDQCGRRIAGSV